MSSSAIFIDEVKSNDKYSHFKNFIAVSGSSSINDTSTGNDAEILLVGNPTLSGTGNKTSVLVVGDAQLIDTGNKTNAVFVGTTALAAAGEVANGLMVGTSHFIDTAYTFRRGIICGADIQSEYTAAGTSQGYNMLGYSMILKGGVHNVRSNFISAGAPDSASTFYDASSSAYMTFNTATNAPNNNSIFICSEKDTVFGGATTGSTTFVDRRPQCSEALYPGVTGADLISKQYVDRSVGFVSYGYGTSLQTITAGDTGIFNITSTETRGDQNDMTVSTGSDTITLGSSHPPGLYDIFVDIPIAAVVGDTGYVDVEILNGSNNFWTFREIFESSSTSTITRFVNGSAATQSLANGTVLSLRITNNLTVQSINTTSVSGFAGTFQVSRVGDQ